MSARISETVRTVTLMFLSSLLAIVSFFLVRTLNQVDDSLKMLNANVAELRTSVTQSVSELNTLRRDTDRNIIEIEKMKENIYAQSRRK